MKDIWSLQETPKKLIITKGKERTQKAGCILVHPVSLGSLQRAAMLEWGGERMVSWRRFQKVGSLLHAERVEFQGQRGIAKP